MGGTRNTSSGGRRPTGLPTTSLASIDKQLPIQRFSSGIRRNLGLPGNSDHTRIISRLLVLRTIYEGAHVDSYCLCRRAFYSPFGFKTEAKIMLLGAMQRARSSAQACAAQLMVGLLYVGSASAACEDILKDGVKGALTSRGEQQSKLVELSRIERDNERSRETEGEYDGISAKYRDHKKEALKQEKFRSYFESSESELAISSGDPVIVNAWLACLHQQNAAGPKVWFEVKDATNISLMTQYVIPRGDSKFKSQTVLTSDVQLPPGLTANDVGGCLKKGAVIGNDGCSVEVRAAKPETPFSVRLYTDETRNLKAYLPARLKAVQVIKTFKTEPYTITVPPKQNTTIPKSFSAEDGWFVVPGSTRIDSYKAREARGGGVRCKPRADDRNRLYDERSRSVSMNIHADNNAQQDTGYCDFVFAFEVFQYVMEPI